MYRTTLAKLIEILTDYGAEIAVIELHDHNLTQDDVEIIEIDFDRDEDDNDIENINEFNIFIKNDTVLFGEHIEAYGDFSIKWAPTKPRHIYEALQ